MDTGERGGMTWFLYGLIWGAMLGLVEAGWDCLLRACSRANTARAISHMQPIYLDYQAGPDVKHAIRTMHACDYKQDAGLILTLEDRSSN